jgi:hypothetical protein
VTSIDRSTTLAAGLSVEYPLRRSSAPHSKGDTRQQVLDP